MKGRELIEGRLALRLASRVITVSDWLRQVIEAQGVRARVDVVPNIIDSRFHPGALRSNTPPVVMLVARLHALPPKGIDDAIRCAAILAGRGMDAQFKIVGDGPERAALEQLALDLGVGDRVQFLGTLSRSEVADALRGTDVFVSASSQFETFGVAVAEAIASGVPVVATRVGAIPELVTDGTGLLVDPGSPSQLADGIQAALSRVWSHELMVASARRFSSEAVADRLMKIYVDVA